MNRDQVRAELRGSTEEQALLVAYRSGGTATHGEVSAALGDEATASIASERLRERELVFKDNSLVSEITLNGDGKAIAEAILASNLSGPDRRTAVQRAFLQWLAGGATPSEPGDFCGSPTATSEGVPFTKEEVQQAAQSLFDWDLVSSNKAWGQNVLRPRITSDGREAADDPRTPREFARQVGSTTYNTNTTNIGHGNSNLAVQSGSGNTQQVSQAITSTQQAEALMLVGAILARLDESREDYPEVRSSVTEIADEVSSGRATKTSVQERVTSALITAGASGAVQLVSEGLTQLLSAVAGWS